MNTIQGRWWWFSVCIAGAVLLLVCGWLVPVHLRAADLAVIQRAGKASPSLIDRGLDLVGMGQLGPAQVLLQAAQSERFPGAEQLSQAVTRLGAQASGLSRVESLLNNGPADHSGGSRPVTDTVIRLENRDRLLAYLQASASPATQELLRCRELTNTVLFPPSASSAGQAFDAALTVCGLLLEENALSPGLRQAVLVGVTTARRRGNSEPLEAMLMDLMSLGQRLNWNQLTGFIHSIEDPATLALLTNHARNAGGQLPLLSAALELSQKPAAVAEYLNNFGQHGLSELGKTLQYGAGALEELFRHNKPIYSSELRAQFVAFGPFGIFFRGATDCALRAPWFAFTVKWFFYLSGGFLIAMSLHVARTVPVIEEPLRVRGFHVFREVLFALGFLLVVLLLSEPFLAQESQRVEFPLRLRLPGVASVAAVVTSGAKTKLMNTPSLLTLLLFFVLQALIYTACLVKLAEIRRQKVLPRVQLKLLENEDHLFDAGLYLGFCGTIVSLILVSLGVIQPSLMAAYSSTSFGIIFVSVFKIFNLRPVRRQLLLQSEADAVAAQSVPTQATYAAAP